MHGRCRKSLVGLLGILVVATAPAVEAGVIITPDSIASPPAPVSPVANGTTVAYSQQVADQYAGLGLIFANAAIGTVNGVKVWVPTLNPFDPNDPNPASNNLNFASPSFVLAGTCVPGNADAPAATGRIRAEFVIAPDTNLTPSLAGTTWDFNNVNANFQTVGTGPHGGVLLELQGSPMSIFGLNGNLTGDDSTPVWGVAQIEFPDALTPVQSVPEPGAALLALVGAVGMVGRRWRR